MLLCIVFCPFASLEILTEIIKINHDPNGERRYNIKGQFMFLKKKIDVNQTSGILFTMMHNISSSS